MLIVEGPDGGGKTRLVHELSLLMPNWDVQPKAVSSDIQAMTGIKEYVEAHLAMGFGRRIYDRFALVSGPIYMAHDLDPHGINKHFWEDLWYHKVESLWADVNPIVIYCLPDFLAFTENMGENQPETVLRKRWDVYASYWARYHHDATNGFSFRYDYTKRRPGDVVAWIHRRTKGLAL